MSLVYNGTTVNKIVYNGTALTKIIYNGVTVWAATAVLPTWISPDPTLTQTTTFTSDLISTGMSVKMDVTWYDVMSPGTTSTVKNTYDITSDYGKGQKSKTHKFTVSSNTITATLNYTLSSSKLTVSCVPAYRQVGRGALRTYVYSIQVTVG